MRFSADLDGASPWPERLDLARRLEATGWDGVWLSDHLQPHQAAGLSHHEAWTSLAALAASVPRIRLGVLVAANTFRHPAVLAKMAEQVDIISGGRLMLGVGSAPTLRDVLITKNADDRHGGTAGLTEEDIEALVAFLQSLP